MVSVLRICLNFLQTRATLGRDVPGSEENISTSSSGGSSISDCGCGGPTPVLAGQLLLRTWLLPSSAASLGPAVTPPPARPPPQPTTASALPPWLWPTIRSSPSSSMSESLGWSSWLCRCCLLLHRRDWPTPQSLAQTAIRSHSAGCDITSQRHTARLSAAAAALLSLLPPHRREPGQQDMPRADVTTHDANDAFVPTFPPRPPNLGSPGLGVKLWLTVNN